MQSGKSGRESRTVGGGGLEWDCIWIWKSTFLLNEEHEIFRAINNLWNISNNSWSNYELLELVWQSCCSHKQLNGRALAKTCYYQTHPKKYICSSTNKGIIIIIICIIISYIGLYFLVLLLKQRWSPPLRLPVSHCSTFRIMCDVPCRAVFCSEINRIYYYYYY